MYICVVDKIVDNGLRQLLWLGPTIKLTYLLIYLLTSKAFHRGLDVKVIQRQARYIIITKQSIHYDYIIHCLAAGHKHIF